MLLPHFDPELWPGHVWNSQVVTSGQWFFSGTGVGSGGGVAKVPGVVGGCSVCLEHLS